MIYTYASRSLCVKMVASQVTGPLAVAEISSFIGGFHVYTRVWQPVVGEISLLREEPTNENDRLAVCVQKEG